MDKHGEFWNRLDDVRTGMIMIGERHLPMSHYAKADERHVYFITAKGTDMANAALDGGTFHYLVCSDDAGFYCDIHGTLEIENSREKLDQVWNSVASAWFEGDQDDPDVCLLKLRPRQAEVWFGGSNPLKFIYEVAKGNLTDEKPDLGTHTTLHFDDDKPPRGEDDTILGELNEE